MPVGETLMPIASYYPTLLYSAVLFDWPYRLIPFLCLPLQSQGLADTWKEANRL